MKELHVYDDSEFLLESCLMFDKDNFDVALDYIDVLIKRQKYAKALEEAEKLYTKDKDNEIYDCVCSNSSTNK